VLAPGRIGLRDICYVRGLCTDDSGSVLWSAHIYLCVCKARVKYQSTSSSSCHDVEGNNSFYDYWPRLEELVPAKPKAIEPQDNGVMIELSNDFCYMRTTATSTLSPMRPPITLTRVGNRYSVKKSRRRSVQRCSRICVSFFTSSAEIRPIRLAFSEAYLIEAWQNPTRTESRVVDIHDWGHICMFLAASL